MMMMMMMMINLLSLFQRAYKNVYDDPSPLFYHNDLLYNCRNAILLCRSTLILYFITMIYCITVEMLSSCV